MLSLALLALVPLWPSPMQGSPRELTVERWVDGEFDEEGPALEGKWLPDGKTLLSVRPDGIALVDALTGTAATLIPASALRDSKTGRDIRPDDCRLSDDRKHALIFANATKVWRQRTRGDYFVWDANRPALRKLGGDAPSSSLMFAKFSPDGSRVAYVRENNLYVESVASGDITRLTTDGADSRINGTSDWVYEEELDVRDAWRWSPDGKSIAYWQFDTSAEPIFTLVDDTDSLYPTLKRFPYPVAGQTNPTVRIGVVPASGGTTVWVKDVATSANGYLARMDWAANSRELILEHLNRKQNEIRYLIANVGTGETRTAYVDSDAAWVDVIDTGDHGVRWLDGGKTFLVLSERDGWRHLYAVPRAGGAARLLTPGAYDVDQVMGADAGRGLVYFTASPDDATQRYLYVARLDGGKAPSRITPAADVGTNEYDVSPTGAFAVHTCSRFQTPPRYDLVRLPEHSEVRGLGDNASLVGRLKSLRLGGFKFTTLDATDGEKMDASLILPPGFDPAHRYPILFFVYGEPAATIVNDQWGGWNAMFDLIVSQRGYIVARVDNRGTPTLKGRAWRKSVFHKIGVLASGDQAAAARQLAKLPYVDASRMAIWGWSGGGSMTLNMMFRFPDIYRVGMSVAPVPDARLYDTIYQERYMGMPQDNDAEYAEDSPITFANRLKGALLIVHGSGDDNVHYAGTERLVNVLVANNKPFQLMVYPNRTHAVDEGPGTTRSLFDLLLRFLTVNMPAK